MGLCTDKSTSYLKGLGYNVVRHPNAALKPLDLIGVQGDSNYLGPLNLLVAQSPGPLPAAQTDVPAADINGQTSSKLDFSIGLSILGNIISALGGNNLGLNASYTDAQKVEFSYTGVLNDQVVPLEVGNYLKNGTVDTGNKILAQYVLGNGDLYLITKTAKSKKFTVSYERSNGTAAKVDVPVIQNAVGGNIKVSVDSARKHVVTYEGGSNLAFGFQCFQVGVADGSLNLTSVSAGSVVAAVGASAQAPALISRHGLLEMRY